MIELILIRIHRLRRAAQRRWNALGERRAARVAGGLARSGVHLEQKPLHAVEGVTVIRNAILEPLRHHDNNDTAADGRYIGGLLDPETGLLVPSAIHHSSQGLCQVGPPIGSDIVSSDEISRPALFAGLCFSHFGHFMAESLARLWAYSDLASYDPLITFLLPHRQPTSRAGHQFVFDVLKGFRIPVDHVMFIRRRTRFDTVFVPEQRYGFGFLQGPSPEFVGFLRGFQFVRRPMRAAPVGGDVYVSRSKFRGLGKVVGEVAFERYLLTQGYYILYPELYSLAQQLTLYERADHIIFADGSAPLACVLLPDLRARVAIIARRRDPRMDCQTLVDCLSGFGHPPLWIDRVRRQFQFGLPTWDALAELDWREVVASLKRAGFVRDELTESWEHDYSAVADLEFSSFLRRISDRVDVRNYLKGLGEDVSAVGPRPHLVDPRTGMFIQGAGSMIPRDEAWFKR